MVSEIHYGPPVIQAIWSVNSPDLTTHIFVAFSSSCKVINRRSKRFTIRLLISSARETIFEGSCCWPSKQNELKSNLDVSFLSVEIKTTVK